MPSNVTQQHYIGEYMVGWTRVNLLTPDLGECSACGVRANGGDMASHVLHQHMSEPSPLDSWQAEAAKKEYFDRVRRGL